MRLPDGREVPDLHVDPDAVARCRALADRVTGQVMGFVERHTTVSIERTVLRQLGFHDAGPRGIPLVNLMVDALHERGLLGQGAAYWFGWALRQGARDPMQVVDRITSLPREPATLAPAEDRALREEVGAEARAAADELRRRVESRNALRAELGMGPRPHKYLIVATGNIHDDVEQARAAAQAGADIIAVIRSTAQSLLDYVPHGATTEGYGGTYATQENFRIMREALDDESRRLEALRDAHQLLVRAVHGRDRLRGGLGAARHAAQRRDVRHPLPRHQHEADALRPVLLPPHQRLRRHHHQHRRGQLHHHRRRRRGRAHGHRQPVHQRVVRPPRRPAGPAHRPRPQLRDRPAPGGHAGSRDGPGPARADRSSPTPPSSTCPPPSTRRGTSSSATPTTCWPTWWRGSPASPSSSSA